MMLVFDNPVLHVVGYPELDAVEVIDKRLGRGVLMRDETARRFRSELQDFVAGDPDIEAFDDFIESYGEWMTQPAIYH
jgi:hypothetical protein